MDPPREHEQAAHHPVSSPGDISAAPGGSTSGQTPQIPPSQHAEHHMNPRPNLPAEHQQPQASGSGSRHVESGADHQQEPTNRASQYPDTIAIRQPEVTTVQPEGLSSPRPRSVRSPTLPRQYRNGYNGQEIRPPPPILINSPRITGSPERIYLSDPEAHSNGSPPLPPLPHEVRSSRIENGERFPILRGSQQPRQGSGLDWIVPEKERTVGDRIGPTVHVARTERDKYALKAQMTGYALNIAIGLQVLLGALTTGLSAATSGHNASISTAILGGIATLVASYLARARGSNEPELSIARVKDLEQFIRECDAFIMDHGFEVGHAFDSQLHDLRRRFEELLGNADGQRRLAPPA